MTDQTNTQPAGEPDNVADDPSQATPSKTMGPAGEKPAALSLRRHDIRVLADLIPKIIDFQNEVDRAAGRLADENVAEHFRDLAEDLGDLAAFVDTVRAHNVPPEDDDAPLGNCGECEHFAVVPGSRGMGDCLCEESPRFRYRLHVGAAGCGQFEAK